MASKSSPEYRAAQKSCVELIRYAEFVPTNLCDRLFADDQISTEVRDKIVEDRTM